MLPCPADTKDPAQALLRVGLPVIGPAQALQLAGLLSIAVLSLVCAAVGLALELAGSPLTGKNLHGADAVVLGVFALFGLLGWLCLAVVWRLAIASSAPLAAGRPVAARYAPAEMQAGLAAGFGTHLAARAPLPGLLCRMIDALPGLAVLVGRDQLDGPWLLLHAHAVQTHAGGRQRLCPAGPPYEELAGALQAWPDWPARLILDTLGGKHHDSAETACGTPTPPATGTAQALVRILPLDAHCAVVWLPPPAAPADPAPEMTTAAAAAATAAARAAAAAQSDAERDAFLFSVSHDLRAPIRVIDGFTRILKEDYGAALDRIGNDHLDRVLGASARMSAMIDALLGLSRLSTRALQRVSVDLSEMAEQVMDELRRQAPQRRAQIIIQPGMTVQGDPTLLRTVLDNLLGNAWKYSARRELTRIELGAGTDDAGRRIFRVSDNGAGFDMRFAERLFGPFQRLHSASEFVGTGVGLASVRRIVHRHGGDIWAQAEVDRGATFCFTLGD